MKSRSLSRLDLRFHDWAPLDPQIKGFVEHLTLRLGRGVRTVREYSRDLEILAAFLSDQSPTIKHRGLKGSHDVPNRGPFKGALLRAKTEALDAFVMHLAARGLSVPSRRRKIAALRTFYAYLQERKLRKDNPASGIWNLKPPERLPKSIEVDQAVRLVETRAAAGTSEFQRRRDRAILEMLYASGVRRAELVSMNLGDINLKERRARVIGKGNRQRIVLFNEATGEAIRRYLEVRPPIRDDALFVSALGRRLSYPQVANIFRSYVKLSGLKGKVTPHTMRHSFATHLHERGVDIMTIKELLGHKNVSTTQVYTQMTMKHVQQAYDEAHPRDSQGTSSRTTRQSKPSRKR